MNFDQSKELFLEEARDLLTKAEAALLALEANPEDLTQVNEVFRGLHTIKGSGAMFGYKEVSEFTHRVENLFDDVRKGKLAVTSDIVEIGLQAADHIARLLEGRDDPDTGDLILQGITDLDHPAGASTAEIHTVRITFRPQPTILHRGVRLESLFADLADLGTLTTEANIDEVPGIEDLDPTSVTLWWLITLETSAVMAEVRQAFLFVEDYAELKFEASVAAPPTEVAPRRRTADLVPPARGDSPQESSTIRVRKEKLDSLVDTVGELVILQARLDQEARRSQDGAVIAISETLGRLTADLRDTTMSVRMVPLEELFAGYQRLVRDLGHSLGKEVVLSTSGGSTELDKNIIESLKDPLLHIIRNSADHGLEAPEARERAGKPREGTISLRAQQTGSRVEIVVSDDGAGLNLARIKDRAVANGLVAPEETDENRILSMIFEPGFSTAEKTTDVSGRGVGMDVVKKNVEKLRGEVGLKSTPGQGTTVTLSIPLTLVIIEGLLVRVGEVDYVITLSSVQECVDLTDDIRIGRREDAIIDLRGHTIPIVSLRTLLSAPGTHGGVSRLVIVQNDGATVGLEVDAVLGRKQVVIKPLSRSVKSIKVVSGATILGDGSVALILDVPEIIKRM